MTRSELVSSARRMTAMVEAISRPNERARRHVGYQIFKDYIALAEDFGAEDARASTERDEATPSSGALKATGQAGGER